MKAAKLIAAVALGYVVVFIAVLLAVSSQTMSRFETGGAASSLEHVLSGVAEILRFPLLPLIPVRWFPGVTSYIPLFLNGCIWAGLIIGVISMIGPRIHAESSSTR